MRAVVLEEFGDVDKLQIEEVEDPQVGAGEVLVRVRATSINPVDWKIRRGDSKSRNPVELPAILGRDLAGEVEQTGAGVTGFNKGQRVMALAAGTYAEFTTVKADVLAPIPEKLTFEQAAALPLVLTTGAQLIERTIKVTPGQRILILGALGGVGRTAVHVALQHGAQIIAGVRKSQLEEAKLLPAQEVVAIDDEDELAKLHDLDAIADAVGGTVAARAIKTLKSGGVFGTVLAPPTDTDKLDVQVRTMRAEPDASRLYQLADDVSRGSLIIPIVKVLPLEKVREAQKEAEDGHPHGKIILLPSA
ncbi:NADP-dependent oxidoreductase [Edaphobacter sp. HDX4]|uniref:NADP-dependent oxidoreductase n=1 Tax=Edaphobacter sp. HDX4 TaxID=2794064 RepID=UPI002FE5DC8E